MIPLYDENRTIRKPYVTIALIVLNALLFFWEIKDGELENAKRVFRYGAVPHNITQDGETAMRLARDPRNPSRVVGYGYVSVPEDLEELHPSDIRQPIPAWMTLLTSMFLHGGWLHVIMNMWFLWVFGNNIEDSMGPGRFLAFYGITGLVAAVVHVVSGPSSPIPTIGASGAISGVLGAYLFLYPRARVHSLVPLGYIFFSIRLPAFAFLGIWFVMQVTNLFGESGGVAWYAHVGGFLAGLALVKLFESREHRQREALPHRGPPRRISGRSFRAR